MSRFKRTLTFFGFRRPGTVGAKVGAKVGAPAAASPAVKPIQTGRARGEFTGPPDTRDRSVTALVYAIYFTMVGLVGLCLVIVFTWLIREPAPPPPPACREDVASSCEEGKICRNGMCTPAPDEICNSGDSCDSCTCMAPASCGADRICSDPRPIETPPGCSDEMAAFVEQLVNHQRDCEATAKGTLLQLPHLECDELPARPHAFDALIKDFPNSPRVHVPQRRTGVRGARGRAWRGGLARDGSHRRHQETVCRQDQTAGGRISGRAVSRDCRTGEPGQQSWQLRCRLRLCAVEGALRPDLLVETLATKDEQDENDEMSRKFLEFALGSERRLRLEFYSANYRRPTAWWSKDAPLELTQALSKLDNNLPVTQYERKKAEEVINRSVAIFAIPSECVKVQR
jgi:hypothetical protein